MNELTLLGLKVRDKVTGFTGVCESISHDLYGCIQAIVKPPVNEKGEFQDGHWFDVTRLEIVDAAPVMEIPGGRFHRDERVAAPTAASGPTEKPHR